MLGQIAMLLDYFLYINDVVWSKSQIERRILIYTHVKISASVFFFKLICRCCLFDEASNILFYKVI